MKQAVILIHGIGEQLPMDTLRGFVDAVWTKDGSVHHEFIPANVWSKPDTASGNFELRRLTTTENKEGQRTDFFEFYWADLMKGTEAVHLLAWLRLLLFRRPSSVPRQLRVLWWSLVITLPLIVGGVVIGTRWIEGVDAWTKAGLSALGCALWYGAGRLVFYNIVGDAARYLHVAPANIEGRRMIREAGVNLLDTLHRSKEYDRIVVVGHSLGSVIGYDILSLYWARRHHEFPIEGARQPTERLSEIESLARAAAATNDFPTQYQEKQSAYLKELQASGHPWLVTDFVTLGSPLAHAALLLARTSGEFAAKKTQRECPTCPPLLESINVASRTREEKFTFLRKKRWVPHHAATFGPTRWTNLFFPCHVVLYGDLVGGPVAGVFGPGVRDVPVSTPKLMGFFSHTFYWTFVGERTPPCIVSLREAVRLAPKAP